MAKRKKTESKSAHVRQDSPAHPEAKARAMQAEIQSWMEKNELTHDTQWHTAEEYYGDKRLKFAEPHYLVLTFEGELYNVLWEYPPDVPDYPTYVKLHAEFDDIVARHGFWYDFEDNVTACFMLNDR